MPIVTRRRLRTFVLLTALSSGLVGCGDDDGEPPLAPTAPGVDLRAEQLSTADLPAGWEQVAEADDDGYRTVDCLQQIDEIGNSATAGASVGFTFRNVVVLLETIAYFDELPAARESYSALVDAFGSCPRIDQDGAEGAVVEISFPRIGEESSTYRMDLSGEATYHLVLVVARKNDRLLYLAYGSAVPVEPDDLEPLARVAVDKLAG